MEIMIPQGSTSRASVSSPKNLPGSRLASETNVGGEDKGQEGAPFGDVPGISPGARRPAQMQTQRSTRDFADYAASFSLGLMSTDRPRDRGKNSCQEYT